MAVLELQPSCWLGFRVAICLEGLQDKSKINPMAFRLSLSLYQRKWFPPKWSSQAFCIFWKCSLALHPSIVLRAFCTIAHLTPILQMWRLSLGGLLVKCLPGHTAGEMGVWALDSLAGSRMCALAHSQGTLPISGSIEDGPCHSHSASLSNPTRPIYEASQLPHQWWDDVIDFSGI